MLLENTTCLLLKLGKRQKKKDSNWDPEPTNNRKTPNSNFSRTRPISNFKRKTRVPVSTEAQFS
jgi:hypothetical protein